MSQTVFITGANRGIGLSLTELYLQQGAQVHATSRNLADSKELHALASRYDTLVLHELDVTDYQRVAQLASELPAIDLLINNAGVMAPPRQVSRQGLELQLATNHLAPMALTTALLPLMEGQPSARVVTVTSGAQYFGRINWDDPCSEQRYDRWQAYSQSKLANVMFALTLEERLRAQASTTRSLAAHPGLARTNLQPASIAANGSRIEAFAYRLMDPLFQSAAMGALPQLHAATAASAQGGEHYGPDGFGGLRGWPQRQPVAPAARDPSQRERLWRLSEALLQGATTPDTPHQSADLAAD